MHGYRHNLYCEGLTILLHTKYTKNFCAVIKNIYISQHLGPVNNNSSIIVLNKYSVETENLGVGAGFLQPPNPPLSTPMYWGSHFNINIDPNYMRISIFLPRWILGVASYTCIWNFKSLAHMKHIIHWAGPAWESVRIINLD